MLSESEIQNKSLPINREVDLGDFKNGVFHQLICPKSRIARISKMITCIPLNFVEIMLSSKPIVK
jgi:hypothetical protein